MACMNLDSQFDTITKRKKFAFANGPINFNVNLLFSLSFLLFHIHTE